MYRRLASVEKVECGSTYSAVASRPYICFLLFYALKAIKMECNKVISLRKDDIGDAVCRPSGFD